ncbi:MAG: hypothetical protein JXB38_10660 [Anaerolineales bacterium]|nr:hypothetical protein [Anaerolineales bacterium]
MERKTKMATVLKCYGISLCLVVFFGLFAFAVCSNEEAELVPSSSTNIDSIQVIATENNIIDYETGTQSAYLDRIDNISFYENLNSSECIWTGNTDSMAKIYFPGIYALDESTAFIFGALGNSQTIVRSILLHTVDGGKSWQEMMKPILSHVLLFVSFVDESEGWALVLFAVESPGDIILYKTENGGKNWDEFITIRTGEFGWGVGTPIAMHFTDEINGKIVVRFEQHNSILSTTDGGVTWEETEIIPSPIIIDFDTTHTIGFDGVAWKIDLNEDIQDKQIHISQMDYSSYQWREVIAIPETYPVQDGCVNLP